jgi:2-polyprenyl-3-methyl-5-hydroxy-6-metoxy-1,4-benzoquinol methylase
MQREPSSVPCMQPSSSLRYGRRPQHMMLHKLAYGASIVHERCAECRIIFVRQRKEGEIMSNVQDRWTAGSTYENFMGQWSRRLAPKFVTWLQVPSNTHWLDVGCGTGALASTICSSASPASVLGCDPAEPFIEYARSHSQDNCASFVVAGVGGLPSRAYGYGSVTSLLALNFFPDPEVAVHEMRSLTRAGGVVSACVWDYAGRMELLRFFWDAAAAMDPTARELDEGKRFPVCRRDTLLKLFQASGLNDIHCEPIEILTEFASFDDYWRPFLGGTGPAPSFVTSLDRNRCNALARRLEQVLPRGANGTIALAARAWAIRGTAD